ncbi:MAG: 3-oxoacid CoA-transferase subunit B [Eggerthellaceae bacterium]|nr:3-oxoacid CoA-transferase subunit B [Eggerthellaceae bacterium]
MGDLKERIARRVAQEFSDGDFVNLGIGIPTQSANFIPEGIEVIFHSENGFAGVDSAPEPGKEDTDLANASSVFCTAIDKVNYFSLAGSFGIVRGGHLNATVLGAMQVAANGDIANWIVPGGKIAGMGGAMDLVVGAKKVIVAMLHTQKGTPKIVKECTLPVTGTGCVDLIITEMGVMEVRPEGLVVTELHSDYTKEDIQAATDCDLIFADDLKPMLG